MGKRVSDMAMWAALVLAVVLCGAGCASALYGPSSDVVQLTSLNFKNKVGMLFLKPNRISNREPNWVFLSLGR